LGDHRGHRAIGRVDGHPLADQLLRIPTADRVGVNKSLIVDVRDQQPNLIGVPGEHHPQLCARIAASDHVAVQVGSHLVGETTHVLAHQALHRLLVTRRAGSFQNPLKKSLGRGFHEMSDLGGERGRVTGTADQL